jgi:hypothetical protein
LGDGEYAFEEDDRASSGGNGVDDGIDGDCRCGDRGDVDGGRGGEGDMGSRWSAPLSAKVCQNDKLRLTQESIRATFEKQRVVANEVFEVTDAVGKSRRCHTACLPTWKTCQKRQICAAL